MNIYLNGKLLDIENPCSVSDFLTRQKLSASAGTAVAVNNKVIPKETWPDAMLHENDTVLIIGASYGG